MYNLPIIKWLVGMELVSRASHGLYCPIPRDYMHNFFKTIFKKTVLNPLHTDWTKNTFHLVDTASTEQEDSLAEFHFIDVFWTKTEKGLYVV